MSGLREGTLPYLPMDLDAKRRATLIAMGLGLEPRLVTGGLLDLWEYVWREKKDVVSGLYLRACVGSVEALHQALVDGGFLEVVDGGFRIRGAKKWLFGMEGKSRGGHAAKGNLIPGAKQKRVSAEKPKEVLSASAQTQPRLSPDPLSAHISALTPSTQQPASSIKNIAGKKSPAPEEPEAPGWKELVDSLFKRFEHHKGKTPEPRGKDWKALKRLRERVKLNDSEVLARWDRGLVGQFKQRVDSFFDLDERWDALAGADPPKAVRQLDFTKGMVRAQDVPKEAFAKVGVLGDDW